MATGSRHHYFGNDAWEPLAPGLKTVEEATDIRRRILLAFEAAELHTSPEARRQYLTFVIIGGGPTGVELAGALSELARDTLRREFRSIDPAEARIVLVEGQDRILGAFPEDLSKKAAQSLAGLQVEVRTGCRVVGLEEGRVKFHCGDEKGEIAAATVLWAAGVRASPLGRVLRDRAGAELDQSGRVIVGPDLSVPGHPEIFVIGDLAHYRHGLKAPLPALATVAMQEGRYAAGLIRKRILGQPVEPFRYRDKGILATIGRSKAVAQLGRLKFSGFLAWFLWLAVHIFYLIEFQNRVLVMIQWAWNYLTRNRGARLITGEKPRE